MNPLPAIDPSRPVSPALDFAALREEGLTELRRLAGETWTDHNLHDPGITLLELLCYGLTDVAYRTTFADAELFAAPPEPPPVVVGTDLGALTAEPDRGPFVTARRALTCEPVTANDYRRLILDAFPSEVRNVWVEPASRNLFADPEEKQLRVKATAKTLAFELRGFYRIRLQLHQHLHGPAKKKDRDALLAAVGRLYHAHRNLGEDLLLVAVTDSLPIRVCAEIQLAPAADIEKTHAAIVHALQEFLNPTVPRHALAELVAGGYRAEEIFSGPPLENGFILEEDLEQTTSIHVVRSSDLIAEILRIPGVVAIPGILLNQAAGSADSEHWELAIPANLEPSLDFKDARLRFYKDLIPFNPDTSRTLAELEKLRNAERLDTARSRDKDFAIPAGTWSDPGDFTTLQESLPATYGCGSRGLNRDRSSAALARARQLQAFLLVFDQILANDLGQLANVGKLFSQDPKVTRSTFARAVSDLPGLRHLLAETAGGSGVSDDEATAAYATALAKAFSDPAAEENHRSAILDHLLARFGERIADEVLMHHGAFGGRSTSAMIHAKGTFLTEIPELSCRRGRGHDLLDPEAIWDTANVSGFKHRLERLLGFPTYTRRSLSDITYDFYEEKDADSKSEIRFRIVDRKSKKKKTLLSGTTKYKTKAAAVTALRRATELGMLPANYDVKQAGDGTWFVTIVDRRTEPVDIVAMRKEFFATEAEALAVRDQLAAVIADRFSEEGCFVVEHLPMWPRNDSWPLLAVPLEATRDSPASWDPYSFHVHIILPGWGARLADTGFRAFVEQVIHRELPAHLVARVCFIGRGQMQEFEGRYRAWLTAVANGTKEAPEVLATFIACLENLHTIYPTGTLHDLKEDGDEQNPIILGRTHLGSNAAPEL